MIFLSTTSFAYAPIGQDGTINIKYLKSNVDDTVDE